MNNDNIQLSTSTLEFLVEVKSLVTQWHERPHFADHSRDPNLARLSGFAGDMIRLLDSADDRGWDVTDIAYEINVGFDEEREDNPDVLLAISVDELERQFDTALCKNAEEGDLVVPIYDGIQYVGGSPSTSQSVTSNENQQHNGADHA